MISRPRRPRRPTRTVRLTIAVSAVVALAAAVGAGWGTPAVWALPLLAVAAGVGEVAVVHLTFGRQRWVVSLTDGVIAAALLLAPGAWMAVAVAVGVFSAQLVRNMPRLKTEFNIAQLSSATSLGALASVTLAGQFHVGRVPAACAGMALFWLVNHFLVAVAVSVTSRRSLRSMLVGSFPLSALHTAGNSSLGLLAAWLAIHAPFGLLALLVPLALLWTSYDQQTRRDAESRLFTELARGQEQATGRSLDVSAQVVLTAAARLFGGADVEMVLHHPDGPVRYAGDEYGVPDRQRVDSDAFGQPWVLRALGARGVSTGVEAGRPYCTAVLGAADHPLAVLIARRPEGAAVFGRRETMLAEVLVGQAGTWLGAAHLAARHDAALGRAEAYGDAARALGDLGAHTTPALVVLRESSERLSRLAHTLGGPDPVSDIVDELHAVERAVASLLGAIALAADPELAAAGAEVGVADLTTPAPARPATDWTTTGRLEAADER